MAAERKKNNNESFEIMLREFLMRGKEKLESELPGTREAIKIIAAGKTKEFMKIMDKGLDKDERELLNSLIIKGMFQSFCYGYSYGMIESRSN